MSMGIEIVEYRDEYAGEISEMIVRNLFGVNIRDYPKEEMERLAAAHTTDKIRQYGSERKLFVALSHGHPIGTLGVENPSRPDDSYHIVTVFVNPEYHGMGIGRLLMEHGENYILAQNGKKVTLSASITAHRFYQRLGYQYRDGRIEPDVNGLLMMDKYL